jgi:type 1 glutamine amidotransferase
VLGLFASLALGSNVAAADKLKLLIIDGQNNHNWAAMTPPMKVTLEKTGRFTVDVATTPPGKSPKEAWDKFLPDFSKYDVVLSNYNGESWPEEVNKSLEKFVSGGGGLVIIHAANNAFGGWSEWNKMIGLGWRDNKFGDRITVDDSGKIVRTAKGEGPGAGHGPQHEFKVIIRDSEHSVTKGMPKEWMHAKDELYHGQRGPAENMHILATAYSASDKGGTGAHEPMIWWIPYGKGRVFTTVMGHVMGNETVAIQCVGFQTVMARGSEWAATGEVTLPIPKDFPTAAKPKLAGAGN